MSIPQNIVDAATEATVLKRKIAALSEQLEEKKNTIRSWATDRFAEIRKNDPGCTMLEVPTAEGTLSVIFPSDKPEVRKGQELAFLAKELLPAKAKLVVVQEWCLVSEFKKTWVSPESPFTKAERKIIEKVIGWKPQTPRVEPAK